MTSLENATPTNISSEIGVAVALEARRLSEKYESDFLDCNQLVEITGFGKNNVRELMRSGCFPTIQVGNRKAVSVIAFVWWTVGIEMNEHAE